MTRTNIPAAPAFIPRPAAWIPRTDDYPLPCRIDPDLFISVNDRPGEDPHPDEVELAKSLCDHCLFRLPCAVEAKGNRDLKGVWGGTTWGERWGRDRRKAS